MGLFFMHNQATSGSEVQVFTFSFDEIVGTENLQLTMVADNAYRVDWGDGTVEDFTGGTMFHSYTDVTPDVIVYPKFSNRTIQEIEIPLGAVTKIDVTKIITLTKLSIIPSLITSIDISKNVDLVNLLITGSNLASIDISNNPDLQFINLSADLFSVTNVNDILIQLDSNGISNGTLTLSGAPQPTGSGITARDNLIAKGWTINIG